MEITVSVNTYIILNAHIALLWIYIMIERPKPFFKVGILQFLIMALGIAKTMEWF